MDSVGPHSKRVCGRDATSEHNEPNDYSTNLYTPSSPDIFNTDLNFTCDSVSICEQAGAYQTLDFCIRGIGDWARASSANIHGKLEDVAGPKLELCAEAQHIKDHLQEAMALFEIDFPDTLCVATQFSSSGER